MDVCCLWWLRDRREHRRAAGPARAIQSEIHNKRHASLRISITPPLFYDTLDDLPAAVRLLLVIAPALSCAHWMRSRRYCRFIFFFLSYS